MSKPVNAPVVDATNVPTIEASSLREATYFINGQVVTLNNGVSEVEADPVRMSLDMKTWDWVNTTYNNDTENLSTISPQSR